MKRVLQSLTVLILVFVIVACAASEDYSGTIELETPKDLEDYNDFYYHETEDEIITINLSNIDELTININVNNESDFEFILTIRFKIAMFSYIYSDNEDELHDIRDEISDSLNSNLFLIRTNSNTFNTSYSYLNLNRIIKLNYSLESKKIDIILINVFGNESKTSLTYDTEDEYKTKLDHIRNYLK